MTRITRAWWTAALALVLSLAFTGVSSAQTPGVEKPQPDNTKTNKRDRDTNAPTADQQKNGKSDLDVTAEIRRAIVADKSLSMYAHNVKIIAENGMVTLKGPVRSDAEKATIEQKAIAVVGQAKVTNQIEVKP